MADHDAMPPSASGAELYDLGSGVWVEWWPLGGRENWGVVEHHWCEAPTAPGRWAMGSVPVWPTENVRWEITQGSRGSFEGLTLTPSILCGRCGRHGWIRDGRWVEA